MLAHSFMLCFAFSGVEKQKAEKRAQTQQHSLTLAHTRGEPLSVSILDARIRWILGLGDSDSDSQLSTAQLDSN